MAKKKFWYVLIYRYETCVDWDDGPGHDYGWSTAHHDIFADSDDEARQEVKKWIEEHDSKHPCNGGMCGNHGRYLAFSLDRNPLYTVVINGERILLTKSES